MRASVIVLTKNNGRTIEEVLAAICSQNLEAGFEVIHIDSGSTDDTLAIAEKYPCRRYRIPSAAFSHSATRNFGAGLARGELLVYVSADATPATVDWLARLIAPLENASVAGVYGRQVPRPNANVVEAYFLDRTYGAQRRAKRSAKSNTLTLEDLFFSNVTSAIRKSVWELHQFDERLHMSEDQGWARDVLRAGHCVVYEPTATVLHSHRYTLGQLFRRNFDSGHSLSVLLKDEDVSFVRYGVRYLTREIIDFARSGHARHLPYLVVHEAVRTFGFFLGRNATYLPGKVRRWCSDYRLYWERLESISASNQLPASAESSR